MTLYQTFHEASLVFRALQNAWPDAVANQFPDRPGSIRRDSAGHAMGFAWPQADAGFRQYADFRRLEGCCSIRWSRDFLRGMRRGAHPMASSSSAGRSMPIFRQPMV